MGYPWTQLSPGHGLAFDAVDSVCNMVAFWAICESN